MIKKIVIVLGILVGIVIILAAIAINEFKPDENLILNFIKDNPDRAAIALIRNDSVIAKKNPDKVMPLASTVKIILAIEYAIQSSKKEINPDEKVPINELSKFYIPNTDGGAHPSWLKSVKDKTTNNSISIREIAKGMIKYSSNANTEWLGKKLGLENINARIDSLGIKQHAKIYNIASSLFVGKERFPKIKGKKLENKLRALSIEEYIAVTNKVHKKLLTDSVYKKDIGDFGLNMQRIWSDNLPGSTVNEYVEIMRKINAKTYFNLETHKYLDEVMEMAIVNPATKQWLEYSGMKRGSTAFVFTNALYATDKKGNKTELAYFFNNLEHHEKKMLMASSNEFKLKILTNKEFRNKLASKLNE